MKRLFVSDFDGTATALDFYKIVLNKVGHEGWKYVEDYRKTGKVDYHFLNTIFGWHAISDKEYNHLIDTYIHDVLKKHGYQDVEVITNPGVFEEGIMRMVPRVTDPFYSDLFGIDKGLVLRHLKQDYDKVYFAGDTEPDLSAALEAHVVFAKGELIPLLEAQNKA